MQGVATKNSTFLSMRKTIFSEQHFQKSMVPVAKIKDFTKARQAATYTVMSYPTLKLICMWFRHSLSSFKDN